MNEFKAPRDKLICVLNCCKILVRSIQKLRAEAGADEFMPVLIFSLLHSNIPSLFSNIQFISRFRNPSKLQSEAGYYLTNVMSAITFIDKLDGSCLKIEKDKYEEFMQISRLELTLNSSTVNTQVPVSPLTFITAASPTTKLIENNKSKFFGSDLLSIRATSQPANPSNQPSTVISNATASNVTASNATSGPKAIFKKPLAFLEKLFDTPSNSSPSSSAASRSPAQHSRANSYEDPTVIPPPTTFRQPPTFERQLSVKDRELLEDYEMQLAMALSLSVAAEEEHAVVRQAQEQEPAEADLIQFEETETTQP